MNLRHFEVGKLFEPPIAHYQEATKFDFTDSGPVLFLFFSGPKPDEIKAVREGKIRVGFLVRSEVIFMLFKFEGLPWMDAPYSIHLSQDISRDPEKIGEGMGYGFNIFLINADTGILEAMRLIGMGTEWSRNFRASMMRQKETSFDMQAYDARIKGMYQYYSSKDLAEMVPYKDFYTVSEER